MDRKQISETGSIEGPEGSEEREGNPTKGRTKARSIDVSVPQVAGSALAAVIAAVVAGKLGVYGTFIGAGVVSMVATTGGPLFQHLFHRTGEQVKEAKGVKGGRGARTAGTYPAADPATDPAAEPAPESGEFGAATTYGTKWRGWKRTLLPAVLVFAVAIGGLTLYEALTGTNVSGGRGGTSIGEVFGHSSPDQDVPSSPERSPDGDDSTGGTGGDSGTGGGQQPSTDPSPDQSGQQGGTGTDGGTDTGGTTPTPTPSPDTPSPDTPGGGDPGGTDSGGDSAGTTGTDGGTDTGGEQHASGEGGQQPDRDAAQ